MNTISTPALTLTDLIIKTCILEMNISKIKIYFDKIIYYYYLLTVIFRALNNIF